MDDNTAFIANSSAVAGTGVAGGHAEWSDRACPRELCGEHRGQAAATTPYAPAEYRRLAGPSQGRCTEVVSLMSFLTPQPDNISYNHTKHHPDTPAHVGCGACCLQDDEVISMGLKHLPGR